MSTSTALARCSFAVLLASSAGLASADTLTGTGQLGFDTNIPIATQAGQNDAVNITVGTTSGTVTLRTDLVLPGAATGIQLNFIADAGTPRETARFIVNNGATLEIASGSSVNFANNGWFNVGFGAGETGSVLLSGGTVYVAQSSPVPDNKVSYLDIGNAGTGTFTQTSGSVELLTSALQIGVNGGVGVYNLEGGSVALNGGSTLYLGSGTFATAGTGTLSISGDATFTTDAQIFIGGNLGGTGTITQAGAESVVSLNTSTSRTIFIGSGGGTGTYQLSAGTFEVGASGVTFGQGAGATGIFTQTGGDFTAAGLVSMGGGGTATYQISAGSSTMNGGLRLANGGTGSMVQAGDTTVVIGGSGITFGGGGGVGSYSLNGGTLTLAGITGGNANSDFIFGGGTLIASQAFNSSASFATELSTGTASIINTNTFDVGWASAISGSGDLTKTGAGILTLSANNSTYSGDVTLQGGTLALTNAVALTAANDVTLETGTTLDTSGAGTSTVVIGALNGTGAVNLGNSRLNVTVAEGDVATYSGVITAGYTSGSAYGRFGKGGAGTLVINGTTMADTVNGTGEFYVTQGTLEQSGGDTAIAYLDVGSGAGATGDLVISGGTLTVNRTFSVGSWGGSGTATQTGGTVFIPDSGVGCTSCGGFYIGNQGGNGVYNLSGGTIDFNGGTLNLGRTNSASSPAFSGTLNISGDGELLVRRGGVILGNWLVNASGGGSTTSGIGDGILNQSGGTIRIENTADLWLSAKGDGTYNFTGGLLQIGGTSLRPNYPNGSGGGTSAFNLGGGTIEVLDTALTTSAAATLVASTTSTIDTNTLGATWSGILSGSGTLKKLGASTLTLGGVNTFTSNIALDEGTLALSNAGALNGSNVAIAAGATLSLIPLASNAVVQAGEISGTDDSIINLGKSWLVTTVGADHTVAYSGSIVSDGQAYDSTHGRFIKAGVGDLDISGATMTGGEGFIVGGRMLQSSGETIWDTLAIGSGTGATGDLAVTGGQISFGIGLRVGDFGGTGTVTQTGGTVKVEATCSDDDRCAPMNIGNQGGTGTYTISDGTLRLIGSNHMLGRNAGANAGGTGTLQINGGLVSVEAHSIDDFGDGTLIIGDGTASATAAEATGILNQTAGTLRMGAGSSLYLAGYGSGTYNLSGGTLEIGGSSLKGNLADNTEGTYAFNLGGGTIDVTGSALTTAVKATLVAGTVSTIDTNALGATWSGVLSGTGGLIKTGASTLTLSGVNTFTGGTRVEAGTVSVSSDANLGGGGLTLVNGSTLAASASFAATRAIALEAGGIVDTANAGTILTLGGTVSGTGGLTKTGAGTVVLTGANTYAGGTTIADGILQIGNGTATGSITGNVATVEISSNLAFNRSDNVTFSGNVSGGGNIRQDGTGILTLSGANTNTGVVTVANGVLVIAGGNAIADTALLDVATEVRLAANETVGNIAGSGIFNLGSYTLTTGGSGGTRGMGGSLQGTGSLVKTGSGVFTLGGINTYTGTTTVLSGGLTSVGTSLSDTALLTVAAGATATFRTADETIGSLTGGGTVTLNGVDLILGGDNSSTTFAGIFADGGLAGGFTKTGTGTFTVSGASTNTGDTTVAEGTLLVTGFLGSGALNVESGATLGGSGAIDGTVTIANGGTLTNISAGTRLSVGALALNETSTVQAYLGTTPNTELYTVAGDLTLDGNLDILSAGNGSGVYKLMSYGGSLTNNGMDIRAVPTGYRAGLNLSTAGQVSVGLADAAGFQYWTADGSTTHGGAGTWTADSQTWIDQDGNVVSSWAGTVGVFQGTAGTVTVSGMQQFQTLEFFTDGYTLAPQTIASGLNFAGGGTLWTEGADVTATVGTRISGSGGLRKVGAGTLVLTGTNSYTGGTRVEAGTLSVSSDGNLGVGGITLANGATLAATASFASSRAVSLETGGGTIDTIDQLSILSLSGAITGTGGLNKAGLGTVILTGANSYAGGTTISGGALQIGDGGTTGSITGNVAIDIGGTLAFNHSNDTAFAGTISGTGSVVKDGAGILTLSGNNSYSGVTRVRAGVLQTAGGNAIGDASMVNVAGELRLGASETIGHLNGSGIVDLGSYTLTAGGGGPSVGFSGSLEGSGSLVKASSGSMILSGINTYTGTTTVQSGMLTVAGGSSLSDTARLTVATGATTIFQANETVGSLDGGGVVGLRGFELTLGGDNTSSVFSGTFEDVSSLAGSFTKTGTGTFEVSGISTNTGATSVEAGTLLVSGTLGTGALNVASGATLTGGGGSIGGAVTVESGGTLVGGYLGGLTMDALTLQAGATTNVTLDTPNAPDSIFYIDGALSAAGTLNVTGTPQYGTGVYRVFAATGGVTDNGLSLGTTPLGGVNTALDVSANAIDLQVTEIGEALQFWSANGSTSGGSGTWTASNLWLYPGGRPDIWLGNVAIFDGAAGTITVEGAQSFQTLEFMTDGYAVNAGTNGSLDVGSEFGQLWAEGGGVTATINAPITGAGGLIKVGAGTVVLTGTNTYAGGTRITQGTLSVSSDANLGAASSGITLNGGTLAATATFASARSVELLAPPIFSRAAAPSISGGIIDTVGAPTTLTLSGVISGEGDLVKTGLGTLILTGNNTYTGLTTISEGTLQIGNGGTAGTIIGDIVNDALLVFARSDTYAFPGSISGTGTVNFNGGTVVFASPDAFTGPINVNGSMVELVDGSVSYSPFTINDGGTIGGSGTIGALTVNGGGTVAPGYSPGTLNVIGNVAFNAGSTYAVDVTPSGAHDLITAGGTVTISRGSAVEVLAEAGVYAATQTYAIVTAGGAVTGAFGTVSSDFAFLTPSLSYDAQNVYLTLDYNNIDFAAFATTPNQAATATAAQSLGFDNPVFDAIFSMSADELPAAFNSLSGEIGASAKGVLIGDSQFVRNAVFERLVTAGSAAPSGMSVAPLGYAAPAKPGVPYPTKAEPLAVAAPTSAIWAQGFGSWGSTDGNGNAASLDRDTGGFFIGADTLVGDWRLGVLGGYSQTSFDVDGRASSGESDNIHAGLYAGTNWGAVNFRAGAAYTWNDISTSRNVGIPVPQLLEADYDAGTAQLFGELGYGLTFGAVDFEPFAGLAYVNLHTDGFSETGGPAALVSGSDSTDATYTTLGLRASTTFETGSFDTTLRGMLGWRHAFGDITPTTAYQFAAGGSPFTVSGLPIAEDALVLDVGLDVALSDAASLGVFYSAQFGDSAQDQSVRGTLNWKF